MDKRIARLYALFQYTPFLQEIKERRNQLEPGISCFRTYVPDELILPASFESIVHQNILITKSVRCEWDYTGVVSWDILLQQLEEEFLVIETVKGFKPVAEDKLRERYLMMADNVCKEKEKCKKMKGSECPRSMEYWSTYKFLESLEKREAEASDKEKQQKITMKKERAFTHIAEKFYHDIVKNRARLIVYILKNIWEDIEGWFPFDEYGMPPQFLIEIWLNAILEKNEFAIKLEISEKNAIITDAKAGCENAFSMRPKAFLSNDPYGLLKEQENRILQNDADIYQALYSNAMEQLRIVKFIHKSEQDSGTLIRKLYELEEKQKELEQSIVNCVDKVFDNLTLLTILNIRHKTMVVSEARLLMDYFRNADFMQHVKESIKEQKKVDKEAENRDKLKTKELEINMEPRPFLDYMNKYFDKVFNERHLPSWLMGDYLNENNDHFGEFNRLMALIGGIACKDKNRENEYRLVKKQNC